VDHSSGNRLPEIYRRGLIRWVLGAAQTVAKPDAFGEATG